MMVLVLLHARGDCAAFLFVFCILGRRACDARHAPHHDGARTDTRSTLGG